MTDKAIDYRIGLVTDTILMDQRITRLKTAVQRCARQFKWTEEESKAIHDATRKLIEHARDNNLQGKPLTCYKCMINRHAERTGDVL